MQFVFIFSFEFQFHISAIITERKVININGVLEFQFYISAIITERLSHGETLFCVWKGQYIMVAYRDGVFVCYEVEERKPEPPKSIAQKAREFFRGMFPLMVAVLLLTSCENLVTRNFGGSQTIELEKGQRLVEITFKDNDLWILTEPMDSDYVPKTKTFYEDSNLGVMQGKITIVEQR